MERCVRPLGPPSPLRAIMVKRSRCHGRRRAHSARWWKGLRFPTEKEIRFVRSYLAALKNLSRAYVEVLVSYCSENARAIRRAAAVSWWESVLSASLPEDERSASIQREAPRRVVVDGTQGSVVPSMGSTIATLPGRREYQGLWEAEDMSRYRR